MVGPHHDGPATLPPGSGTLLPPRWQLWFEPGEPEPDEPRSLGRYTVTDKLGSGGQGTVFEGIDGVLGRLVALKVCTLATEDAAAMIEHEARCLARVAHPNVVTVYEVIRHGPDLVMVMEFVLGQTLRPWLRATNPSWREILDRFMDAGRGLEAAHQVGIHHGDFKPDNVLVGDDGRVRVIDFGLARYSTDLDADADAEPVLRGTRCYMAPEQLVGKPGGVAGDVFALSGSLWEAVYGARPYTGVTEHALLEAIERGELVKGKLVPGVPAEIEAVLRRGLSARASERPTSIAALRDALEQASRAPRDREERRRRWAERGLLALASGVVGLALAALVKPTPFRVEPLAIPMVAAELDPIPQTLARAKAAADKQLHTVAIGYLDIARSQAHMAGDEAVMRAVADQAEALGDEFDRRADYVSAYGSWDIAHDLLAALPNTEAPTERVLAKLNQARSK